MSTSIVKTQIRDLRTGKRGVMLNNNIQYENKGGSNYNKVSEIWDNVIKENPNIRGSLSIQGNEICVDNGKNDFKYICPSFVEIL